MSKRLVVIGGGPGGYVAAIKAAQLNVEVTLIEKDTLGGTCLNRGCVPTKVLLHSVDLISKIKQAAAYGISAEKVSIDFKLVNKRKNDIVNRQVANLKSLMRKNKIRVVNGVGTLLDNKTVGILGENEKIKTDNILIATGSQPSKIKINGVNNKNVITSDDALLLERPPRSIIIIGGGVIGLEFAQIFHGMCSRVTVIELMPTILPMEDADIVSILEKQMRKEGIEIITDAKVSSIETASQDNQLVSFKTRNSDNEQTLKAEKIMLAVGRQPYTADLGVEKVGLASDNGRLMVNERMETNLPGVYAIGDVVGKTMLAHVAMEEGKCAVENMMGAKKTIDYDAIPRCIYTSPEVAAVGLTQTRAIERHGKIKIGRFPFTANGRAFMLGETVGMAKIIAEPEYGEILGVHIIGPQATELIAEAVLGKKMEATLEDFSSTVHAHPSLSEVIMEASLNTAGKAIHL